MKRQIPILRRKPSATFPVQACDDETAWDMLLLMIRAGEAAGVTAASVQVRRAS